MASKGYGSPKQPGSGPRTTGLPTLGGPSGSQRQGESHVKYKSPSNVNILAKGSLGA